MKKEFNVTGICRPAKHYMADTSAKLAHALTLVEGGKYFAINRPRQDWAEVNGKRMYWVRV